MKRFCLAGLVAMLLLPLSAGQAMADLNVGDNAPEINFKTIDNKTITSKSLEGWIVAVVFWSTDDGWMVSDDMPLLKLQADFSLRGVQFVTVDVDHTMTDVRALISEKKVTAPVVFEKGGPEGPLPKAWDVDRYPLAIVVGPNGRVLAKTHPSKLDSFLVNALAEHPPKLSKEALTDLAVQLIKRATQWLDAHRDNQDYRYALQSLEYIDPSVISEPAVLVAAARMVPYFNTGKTEDRQSLTTYRQAYVKAASILDVFDKSAAAAAKLATSRPAELTPAQRKEALAKSKFEAATAFEQAHKRLQAYKAYKAIVEHYHDTDPGREAAARVKVYEGDEKFMAEVRLAQNEEDAKALLAMARSYSQAGNDDMAKKTYTEVIAKFPGTAWAEEAQAGLSK